MFKEVQLQFCKDPLVCLFACLLACLFVFAGWFVCRFAVLQICSFDEKKIQIINHLSVLPLFRFRFSLLFLD